MGSAEGFRVEVTPNHAGYVEAQERLRRLLGEAVVLLGPVDATYDPSVALDPESGEPFDPLATPTSSAQSSALIHGRIAIRSAEGVLRGRGERSGALGFVEEADLVVIAPSAAASAASGAVGMVIRGERYEIRAQREDGLAGVDRLLIFGARDPV